MIQRLELPRLENENSVENPDWLSMKNQRQRTVLDKETDDKVKCALDIYSRMKMALGNSLWSCSVVLMRHMVISKASYV